MTELLGTLVKFQVGFDALSGSQQIIGNIGKAFGASDAAIAGMATGLGTAVAGITAAAVAAYALYQTARDITGLTGAEGLEKAMAEQAGKPGGGRNLSPDEIQRAKRGAVERAVDATAGGLDSAADWVLNNIWDPFGGGSDAKAAKDPNRGELRRFKADQARASIGLQGDIAAGPNRFANRDESRKGLTDEQRLVDLKKEQLELDTKDNDIRLHSIASDATKTEFLEKSAARHRDVQKQIVEALQSQGRTLQDNLAKQQQALATAQAIVDKEKAKADSIAEQVGNLNELEQAELEILAAKIAAGTNTREDTKRAAQLAPGIYGQRDAEEARAAGEDRASRLYRQEKGFGLREGQHAGENERDQIEGQIENLRNELNKKGDEAELAVKELTAAIIADRDRAIKVILDAAKAFRGAAQ
jgi:hypothetical protein